MSERFIKFIPSDEAEWLLINKPNASRLLQIIAMRARREPGHPDGLKPGECYLGDWRDTSFTEQQYRTAKDILVARAHIKIVETCRTRKKSTTGTTTVGTKVKLISSTVWDLNINLHNDRINDRATTEQRPSNDKQERNKKEEEQQQQPVVASFLDEVNDNIDCFQKNIGEITQTPPQICVISPVRSHRPITNNQEEKEQQQAVAVASFLDEVADLTADNRQALSKFHEDRIKLAIEFSKKEKPTKSLIHQLVWHCSQKVPPIAAEAKADKKIVEANLNHINGFEEFYTRSGDSIIFLSQHVLCLTLDKKEFKDSFNGLVNKYLCKRIG